MSYTKYHESWTATDMLSAAAFNNLESQWTEIKSDADIHNHDDLYYTKTESDAKFFTTTFYTGFDADKIDGQHLSDLVSSVLPIGVIMMWDGDDSTIPDGWYVCNGGVHNGYTTPDLRDRFVIGAGGTYAVNETGGVASWNGTITPTGVVTIGDHALITAELPSHTHAYSEICGVVSLGIETAGPSYTRTSRSTNINNQDTGDGTHGHTGSTATFDAIDPRPYHYSLYYIMKCE